MLTKKPPFIPSTISIYIQPDKFLKLEDECLKRNTTVDGLLCAFIDYYLSHHTHRKIEKIDLKELEKDDLPRPIEKDVIREPEDQKCPKCDRPVPKENHTQNGRYLRYRCSHCKHQFCAPSKNSHFTPKKIERVKRLYCYGLNYAVIAKEVQKSAAGVYKLIRRLQNNGELPLTATISQLKNRLPDNLTYTTLIDRMESYSDESFTEWIKTIDDDKVAWIYNRDYQANQFTA